MNAFSRIALCGQISGYNNPDALTVRNFRSFLRQPHSAARIHLLRPHGSVAAGAEGTRRARARGKLKYRESIAQGLENAPAAFIGLLNGQNFGKQLVKLI